MPIFDYKCLSCSHEFEYQVLSTDDPVPCEECGVEAKRQFTPNIRVGISIGVTNADKSIRDKIKNEHRPPSNGVSFDNGREIIK